MPTNDVDVRHTFYFEYGLKLGKKFSNIEKIIKELVTGEVDGYNKIKGENTTYDIEHDAYVTNYLNVIYKTTTKITLICKRDTNYKLIFYVEIRDDYIQKIGQLPSSFDLLRL